MRKYCLSFCDCAHKTHRHLRYVTTSATQITGEGVGTIEQLPLVLSRMKHGSVSFHQTEMSNTVELDLIAMV